MNSIVSAAEGPVNPRFLAYSMKSGEIVQTLIALLKMCASFSRGWCNQMPGINRRRGNKDVRVAIGIVPERTVFFFTMKASANLPWRTHDFPWRRGRRPLFSSTGIPSNFTTTPF
jgi:hypothetical protein